MFNMDIMKAGADAFGKIAEDAERVASFAYAYALDHNLRCPYQTTIDDGLDNGAVAYCTGVAAHPEPHNVRPT